MASIQSNESSIAQQQWELENNMICTNDELFMYDAALHQDVCNSKPWAKDPRYFKFMRISAVALLKMMLHARSGGKLEIMGLLIGKVSAQRTLCCIDVMPLPVEGTETRVNAQDEANEYMSQAQLLGRRVGRAENVIGWYHSHPGYGCWLSGIDVDTQATNQNFQDPFVAVVIDPLQTLSSGRLSLSAFRTYPDNFRESGATPSSTSTAGGGGGGSKKGGGAAKSSANSSGGTGTASGSSSGSGSASSGGGAASMMDNAAAAAHSQFQSIPLHKVEDFGVHCERYYALEVSYFKSSLDAQLLDQLWQRYWVSALLSKDNSGPSNANNSVGSTAISGGGGGQSQHSAVGREGGNATGSSTTASHANSDNQSDYLATLTGDLAAKTADLERSLSNQYATQTVTLSSCAGAVKCLELAQIYSKPFDPLLAAAASSSNTTANTTTAANSGSAYAVSWVAASKKNMLGGGRGRGSAPDSAAGGPGFGAPGSGLGGGAGSDGNSHLLNSMSAFDIQLSKWTRDSNKLIREQMAGLMTQLIKQRLFHGRNRRPATAFISSNQQQQQPIRVASSIAMETDEAVPDATQDETKQMM